MNKIINANFEAGTAALINEDAKTAMAHFAATALNRQSGYSPGQITYVLIFSVSQTDAKLPGVARQPILACIPRIRSISLEYSLQ